MESILFGIGVGIVVVLFMVANKNLWNKEK